MLVYGDQQRREDPRRTLARIAEAVDRTGALIEAGELAQGLADAEFATRGVDDDTPLQQAAMALCVAVAADRNVDAALGRLDASPLPAQVSVKTPEGYAFYGVYPQSYAQAAASRAWPEPPFVIGLRSIGTSLAAVVAAATGARDVVTIRPTGHPFQRELRVSRALTARLAAHAGPFAIVDEGPGLSGSSFGAAVDFLEGLGVPTERIVVLPGHHSALGPQASPAHRARWARLERLVGDAAPAPEALFADLTGAAAPAGLPGGSWKSRLGSYSSRFVGLGAFGRGKLARAQALHDAGFGPEPVALRKGLLLQRWVHGAGTRPGLDHLAGYLRFRRDAFPAEIGAAPSALIEMVRVNVGALLGDDAGAAAVRALRPRQAPQRAVHVDGRLHADKWLRTPSGVVKLDALDHSQGHDLIGPQDIGWDVAGAEVELRLTEDEVRSLAQVVGADPAQLPLYRLAYPAFQAGLASLRGEDVAPYRARLARLAAVAESAD